MCARAATATRSSPTTARNAYDYGPGLEQVVADYLAAHRPYTPKLDGRITEIARRRLRAGRQSRRAAAAPAATGRTSRGGSRLLRQRRAKPAAAASAEGAHVDRRRRQLWNLAKTYYDDPTKWQAIADANPGNRPRHLPIGIELTIPAAAAN